MLIRTWRKGRVVGLAGAAAVDAAGRSAAPGAPDAAGLPAPGPQAPSSRLSATSPPRRAAANRYPFTLDSPLPFALQVLVEQAEVDDVLGRVARLDVAESVRDVQLSLHRRHVQPQPFWEVVR